MTDRPIIFSAPMVRALLDCRKTQTRRVLKPQPSKPWGSAFQDGQRWWTGDSLTAEVIEEWKLPFATGDRLYVREAFSYERLDTDRNGFMPPWYWADGNPKSGDFMRPKPSIHMPRWASRLTLTVTDVRVQRLQEISEADAAAEGLVSAYEGWATDTGGSHWGDTAVNSYRVLWNDLHGPDAWDANPWVAAITFSVHRANIDQMEAAHPCHADVLLQPENGDAK